MTLVILGSIAFLATILTAIPAFIQITRFSRSIGQNHPEVGKVSVFGLSAIPALNPETRSIGNQARMWVIVTLAMFCIFVFSGLAISLVLPK
jgi:hypothetical protein